MNAALAAVTGIAPRDEAEAMLAAQMVSVHWLAMTMLQRAALDQPSFEIYDSIVNRATKLLRTYTAQLEALKRYRSAGEQRVVVQHQHVNVNADQAAVQVNGVAPDPGGRGAASKPEGRAHEQQLGHASSPRCRARNRRGTPCQQAAVGGRKRCRLHGGAEGSGGPPGNRKAFKHGRYTAEAVAKRREVAALLRACRDQLGAMRDG